MLKYNSVRIRKILEKRPDIGYTDFVELTGVKLSPSTFRWYKAHPKQSSNGVHRKWTGTRKTRRPSQRMFTRVWYTSTDQMSKETKTALKNLVEDLVRSGVLSARMVEMVDPPSLEVHTIS